MNEIWKDIADFEGWYRVSNLGRIERLERRIYTSDNRSWIQPGNMMKPLPDMKGYQNVVLCKNGNSYNKIIHRLVAQAFIPNPNNLPEVNHKDGNKANNYVDNLEWITHRENVSHGKLMYNKTSKYSGVCFKNNSWTVSVQYLGKIHTVDGFGSEDLAREYHLNFLKEKGLVNRFA